MQADRRTTPGPRLDTPDRIAAEIYGDEPLRPVWSREEKQRFLEENRAALQQDLLTGRLEFASKPFILDMQLSNFCNMSCTMCYDGENPPLKHMPRDLVVKIAAEVLPWIGVMVPFSGSEPLVLTWETTRRLAARNQVELDVVTNVQFLDEERFAELEPLVGRLTFSIDSHVPGVYERIRLRANTKKVFRNLPIAARLAEEHGIEVVVNAVLMTENAAWMPETIEYMADQGIRSVHVLQYNHLLAHRRLSDPSIAVTPEYLQHIKHASLDAARRKGIRVIWEAGGYEDHDFRSDPPAYRTARASDHFQTTLMQYLRGYCTQSVDRIKVDNEGRVYPCCVMDDGKLALGNLNEQSFEEIWNGPTAQDLRRAMLTGDYPKHCRQCSFIRYLPQPWVHLKYMDAALGVIGQLPDPNPGFGVEGPEHGARLAHPPRFRIPALPDTIEKLFFVWGLGGEAMEWGGEEIPLGATEYELPAELWSRFRANFTYWWDVWAISESHLEDSMRMAHTQCFTKHVPLPRIRGSKIEYDEPSTPGKIGTDEAPLGSPRP